MEIKEKIPLRENDRGEEEKFMREEALEILEKYFSTNEKG